MLTAQQESAAAPRFMSDVERARSQSVPLPAAEANSGRPAPLLSSTSVPALAQRPSAVLHAGEPILLVEYRHRAMLTAAAAPYLKFVDRDTICNGKEVFRLEKASGNEADKIIRYGDVVHICCYSDHMALRGSKVTKYVKLSGDRDDKAKFIVEALSGVPPPDEDRVLRPSSPFELRSVAWSKHLLGKCFMPPFMVKTELFDTQNFMGCATLGNAEKPSSSFLRLSLMAEPTELMSRFSDVLRYNLVAGVCPRCQNMLQGLAGNVVVCRFCKNSSRMPAVIWGREHPSASAYRNDYACPHCTRVFVNPADLVRHVEDYHSQEGTSEFATQSQSSRCPECNVAFEDPVKLVEHVQSWHPDSESARPVKAGDIENRCNYCGLVCSSAVDLVSHVESVHRDAFESSTPAQESECPICGLRFLSAVELVDHVEIQHKSDT